MAKEKWTYESIRQCALNFKYRTEFKKAYPGAYSKACAKGWLQNVCSHMAYKTKPSGYWTLNRSIKEAKKYSSRESLRSNSSGAYNVLYANNMLDEACSHMFKVKDYSYLRYAYAIEFPEEKKVYVGITYNLSERKNKHFRMKNGISNHKNHKIRDLLNRKIEANWVECGEAFHLNNAKEREIKLYDYYKNEGWELLNISKLGSTGAKPRKTKHECHLDALKYSTRNEFSVAKPSSYGIALKHGWLDEICSHMEELLKPKGYWTFERCSIEAKKYQTRKAFKNNCPGGYSVASKNKWLTEMCSHMRFIVKPNGYWTKTKCIETAKKYNSIGEFRANDSSAYVISKRNGWLKEINKYLTRKVALNGTWDSIEACRKEALKYKNRTEFNKKSRGAYASSRKNGWLNEICSHMKLQKKPNGYWSFENCKTEAEKYYSKIDFKKGNPSAYNSSRKNNWLNEFFDDNSQLELPI